jgi:hypothetical protein
MVSMPSPVRASSKSALLPMAWGRATNLANAHHANPADSPHALRAIIPCNTCYTESKAKFAAGAMSDAKTNSGLGIPGF